MIKKICVFCGSSDTADAVYLNLAFNLGAKIADLDKTLVHGAGRIGLMGELMRGANQKNGEVIGIVPEKLNSEKIVCKTSQQLIITSDMYERKKTLISISDAFIILPGGFGTLDELSEVVTLKQLRYHSKPIIILNYNQFYDKLLVFFENLYDNNFANNNYRNLYYIADNIEDTFNYLSSYQFEFVKDKYLDR